MTQISSISLSLFLKIILHHRSPFPPPPSQNLSFYFLPSCLSVSLQQRGGRCLMYSRKLSSDVGEDAAPWDSYFRISSLQPATTRGGVAVGLLTTHHTHLRPPLHNINHHHIMSSFNGQPQFSPLPPHSFPLHHKASTTYPLPSPHNLFFHSPIKAPLHHTLINASKNKGLNATFTRQLPSLEYYCYGTTFVSTSMRL